jgi:LmbE family N-acetylglucosaminyl deacetylase
MTKMVVVAHPDDECLWLSSVLAAADRIVFCFGDQFERPKSSAARRAAVAALDLPGLVDLKLPESGAGFSIDWRHPQLTPTGIAITDAAAGARYDANFTKLVEALRPVLAGAAEVYTHNPWGEYGHAEHLQVHRAITSLQAEFGYTIWWSNYVGAESWPLAQRLAAEPCWTRRRIGATDRALARRLMRVYRRHGAWTWTLAHLWPATEMLYAQPPAGDGAERHAMAGEILLDTAALRWWPPWRAVRRRLD